MQVIALGSISAPRRRKISTEAPDQRRWAAAMVFRWILPGGLTVLDLALSRALPVVAESRHTRIDIQDECHRGFPRLGVTYCRLNPSHRKLTLVPPQCERVDACGEKTLLCSGKRGWVPGGAFSMRAVLNG